MLGEQLLSLNARKGKLPGKLGCALPRLLQLTVLQLLQDAIRLRSAPPCLINWCRAKIGMYKINSYVGGWKALKEGHTYRDMDKSERGVVVSPYQEVASKIINEEAPCHHLSKPCILEVRIGSSPTSSKEL